MTPMAASTVHNHSRRRPAQGSAPHRRPLARSNSSLLGTIKNMVTAPLNWFAAQDDFDSPPDLKGKRRRNATGLSSMTMNDSEGPPPPKRMRVNDQIQFHPEPQYVAPPYTSPPTSYLDPPEMVFTNSLPRSTSITRGLFRTMSIDPPHNLSREPSLNMTPFERDTSIDRSFSALPRDISLPRRLGTSLTPQPAILRELSEPPPLAALAQKPMFVRPPIESSHVLLNQSSTTSTLGSLVESQRRNRSPMHQSSSLLFGIGSQEHDPIAARHPARTERALHELDVYRTPLLPTRSRIGVNAVSHSGDASDLFRPRRASQLLLMRDDRRVSRLGRKTELGFLDPEVPKERQTKQVNDTKPYAGEGGMKKLLARRMKEVEEESPVQPVIEPALTPPKSPWTIPDEPQQSTSTSSLRVGRTKTSRNHFTRPSRPSKKFSAAYEETEDVNDDADELERQKERQELEEAAKRIPTFDVPAGFSFAKEPDTKPPIIEETDAKEPPIPALPFSFVKPSAVASVVPPDVNTADLSVPSLATSAAPSFDSLPMKPQSTVNEGSVPNFFGSSKLLSEANTPLLSTVTTPSFIIPPSTNVFIPSKPVEHPPASMPIRDIENPFWVDGNQGKADDHGLVPSKAEDGAVKNDSGFMSFSATPVQPMASDTVNNSPAIPAFSFSSPAPAETTKGEEPKPSSSFTALPSADSSKSNAFSFSDNTKLADAPKPFSFGQSSIPTTVPKFGDFAQPTLGAPKSTLVPPPTLSFGAATPASDPPKPVSFSFGTPSATTSTPAFSFGAAPDPKPSPAAMFSFGATERPVTPPRNEAPEFKMDESPTRDPVSMETKPIETRPSLSSSPFSFGHSASNSTSIFGATASATPGAPFSFSGSTSNPFGSVTTESKPFGNTDFGRPSSSSSNSFSFGQNNTSTDPPRPSTAGSFSFAPAPSSSSPFTFGAPTSTTSSQGPVPNAFGSAPSSPSTFGQQFSFGGGTSIASSSSTAFTFGATSQPASPAGSVSTLPQPSTPGGFGGGPSFGAGGGGGSLFTIGAAPTQQRAMKKLPRRKN